MASILFKITSRSRPVACLETLRSIVENISSHHAAAILISLDTDDPFYDEYVSKIVSYQTIIGFNQIIIVKGESKNKVDAMNRDVSNVSGWDILANVSDDQRFIKPFFDVDIVEAFNGDYDRFLHFNDQTPAGSLIPTMSIMGKPYYDRFGYIYSPDYVSLFCDEEARDVAKILDKYKYVDHIIYHHLHPWWVPGLPIDDQLKHTQTFYAQDEKTYNRRKRHGFPLHSVY